MDRILLVEDDAGLCEILQFYLSRDDSYLVTEARSAEEALRLLQQNSFDAILLDIMLPGMDGLSFCREVRRKIYCPIIFISCMEDDATIIQAMDIGGDDYLIKPFNHAVLKARLAANIRRSRMQHPKESVLFALDLRLDPATGSVFKGENQLFLSPTEYEILYYMMSHKAQYMPYEDIYTNVWGQHSGGDVRTLFTHVWNLRKKIGDDARNPRYILTHSNGGYVFCKDEV